MDNIKQLRFYLSKGETKYVIEEIVKMTAADTYLHNQAIALSSRFHQYEASCLDNKSDQHNLGVEFNRINATVLFILEQLETRKPNGLKRKKLYILIACSCVIAAILWFWLASQSSATKEGEPAPSDISAPKDPVKEATPEKTTKEQAHTTPSQPKTPTYQPRSEKGNVLNVEKNNGNAVQNNNDGDVHQNFTIHPTPPKEEKNEKQ